MKQLYDEIDNQGRLVGYGIILQPGMVLPQGHRWVPHTPTLESLKYDKKAKIEALRDSHCYRPVVVLGHTWQADTRSQELLYSTILLGQSDPRLLPKTWRTLNNLDIPVSLENLKEIASAASSQVQRAYEKSWQLKQKILEATTAEELASITWS